MRQAGAEIDRSRSGRSAGPLPSGRPKAVDMTTEEYPGFATDLQAQYMAWMTTAQGISFVTETIFENRFMHAPGACPHGGQHPHRRPPGYRRGRGALTGAQVIASDLRASASLVLAALVAQGETIIDRVYHMDRGYERIEEKLAAVGAHSAHRADQQMDRNEYSCQAPQRRISEHRRRCQAAHSRDRYRRVQAAGEMRATPVNWWMCAKTTSGDALMRRARCT